MKVRTRILLVIAACVAMAIPAASAVLDSNQPRSDGQPPSATETSEMTPRFILFQRQGLTRIRDNILQHGGAAEKREGLVRLERRLASLGGEYYSAHDDS